MLGELVAVYRVEEDLRDVAGVALPHGPDNLLITFSVIDETGGLQWAVDSADQEWKEGGGGGVVEEEGEAGVDRVSFLILIIEEGQGRVWLGDA